MVGLELLREVTWKKIIPDPRVWLTQLGSSAGQVTLHYRPSYEFHRGFLHKSFDMFQSQCWFHSNQMEDFLHMNKCPCGMLCPRCIRSHAQQLVHDPMIADLALAEQFPRHLAELNKQNSVIPYQFSALWFSHENVFPTSVGF